MQPLENIDLSKPVQVYRNLNKPGCQFSVKQNGRVRCYVDSIILIDAKFKHATEKQLAEVRTGARQVCQWITGRISETLTTGCLVPVACDPKKADGFCVDGKQINYSPCVMVGNTGCFASL